MAARRLDAAQRLRREAVIHNVNAGLLLALKRRRVRRRLAAIRGLMR